MPFDSSLCVYIWWATALEGRRTWGTFTLTLTNDISGIAWTSYTYWPQPLLKAFPGSFCEALVESQLHSETSPFLFQPPHGKVIATGLSRKHCRCLGENVSPLVLSRSLWCSFLHFAVGPCTKWKVCSHVYSAVNFDIQFPRIISYGPDFNMEDGLTKTAFSFSADTFFLYLSQSASHRSSGDWSLTGSRALSLFFVPLLMSF